MSKTFGFRPVLLGFLALSAAVSAENRVDGPFAGVVQTLALPERVRWIAVGGGEDPASSPVSLEQNVSLFAERAGGRSDGVILFAGGAGVASVQVLGRDTDNSLLHRLGELFDPRGDRANRYRKTILDSDGPATEATLTAALAHALSRREENDPLTIYLTTHGLGADVPRDGRVVLWGSDAFRVSDLAQLLDGAASHRQVRVIVTSCFAGGFEEIAFAGGFATDGAAATDRCGLFATTWDRESSGCDPNPERSAQEGYSIHFLNALAGLDRDGAPLDSAELDLDGDGRVSLLEAHTRARIASRSVDIPTTTSERWLRARAPDTTGSPVSRLPLPEDDRVIEVLGRELDLADEAACARHLEALTLELEERSDAWDQLDAQADDPFTALRIALLERWPALDDPWNRRFHATIARSEAEVREFLDRHPAALGYAALLNTMADTETELQDLEQRLALVRRLSRAFETRELAARLEVNGGADWAYYQRLLACERGHRP